MADEHIRPPSGIPPTPEAIQAAGNNSRLPPGTLDSRLAPTAKPPQRRSETALFARWVIGMLLVLLPGWGFILLVILLVRVSRIHVPFEVATVAGAAGSLILFILLERNLWLTRFMGLRTLMGESPFAEAIFLWLLGVPGLLLRSTVDDEQTATADQIAPGAGIKKKPVNPPAQAKDVGRELVETVVFVIVLVLLLKTFVAEAFVIPTGSMATTLLGYHRKVICPECGYSFPVNVSKEVDPQESVPTPVVGCTCPNCRLRIPLKSSLLPLSPGVTPQGELP